MLAVTSSILTPAVYSTVPIRRVATKSFQLSDGTPIRKGRYVHVSARRMMDRNVYQDPSRWDPRRFLDLRKDPKMENLGQFVTTSPEHIGFGHGVHSCPGRFFASNELKIILCQILMKYDLSLAEGDVPNITHYGISLNPSHSCKMLVRRRKSAIDIDSI
jgi:cytochrome P450